MHSPKVDGASGTVECIGHRCQVTDRRRDTHVPQHGYIRVGQTMLDDLFLYRVPTDYVVVILDLRILQLIIPRGLKAELMSRVVVEVNYLTLVCETIDWAGATISR